MGQSSGTAKGSRQWPSLIELEVIKTALRAHLFTEDGHADVALLVDPWVINFGLECDLQP